MFDFNNMFQKLRLQQIFGQPQEPTPTFPGGFNLGGQMPPEQSMPMETDDFDPAKRMAELYHPETQNIDAYTKLAGERPEFKNPGKLRNIGAIALATLADSFGGGGGRDAFAGMTGRTKYNQDVLDWKSKMEPLENAAAYERQMNNQNRQFATSTVNSEITQRKNERTAANNEEKTRIANMRAQVYEWKARNPMAKIISPKGGNVQAINPITGQVIMDFGPSGTMTDQDRINLESTNRMTLQNDAQAARAELQDDQQAATSELEDKRQGNRITLKGTPTGNAGGGNKPESSTQKRVGEFIRARQFANSNPQLGKYVELGDPGSNDFRITPPATKQWWGGMSSGPTQEEYNQIQAAIYGTPEVPKTNVPPPAPPKPNTGGGRASGPGPNAGGGNKPPQAAVAPIEKQVRNKQTGEVRTVISTDGGKTWNFKQ